LASLAAVLSFVSRRGPGGGAAPEQAATVPELHLADVDPQIVAVIERACAAVKRDARSGTAWGTLGVALVVHKLEKEALPCLAQAEKLQPTEPRWPYFQGIALLTSDSDAAVVKLARGADLTDPSIAAPRIRVAQLLIERGRLDEAERYLRAVLERQPNEPRALLALGKLELAHERFNEARDYLLPAANAPETARAATVLLASVHQRLGEQSAAAAASRRAESLPPDPPLADPFLDETGALQSGLQAWLTRADRALKSGRRDEALALFEKTIATYPDAAIAWQLFGQAHIDTENYPAAEKALKRAVELAPDSAESYFQLASALFLQNKLQPAVDEFKRSIALRPNYAPGHYNLGICLSRAQKRKEAIAEFEEAIRLSPNFADAHRWLGATLALEERFDEALPPLRRALELNPSDGAAGKMIERAELRAREMGAAKAPK
jgi:tetratricopeptide (TPR) repeat protein